jgi:copper chaperone CopZ
VTIACAVDAFCKQGVTSRSAVSPFPHAFVVAGFRMREHSRHFDWLLKLNGFFTMSPRLCAVLPLAAAMLLIAAQRDVFAAPPASKSTVITVGEMCGGCVKQINAKLKTIPEIAKVECDLNTKSVTITPKPEVTLSPKMLWETFDSIGKTPVKLTGPDGTFTSKPKS